MRNSPRMSTHALCSNLGYANRVAMDFADKRVLPREMAREYLQMGARAIMQMWHDLEQETPADCKAIA
ncbi:hypothetical protein [Acetobacter indonesiensis]|uniref:hypothetical protein n=1 Tax=Acetobacter indonesiensis TaxID=104101 RepID=UPI0039E8EC12